MTKKTTPLWIYVIAAIALTLFFYFFQRFTGPTYEKDTSTTFNGKTYQTELPRSHDIAYPCIIALPIADKSVSAQIVYRLYPPKKDEAFTTVDFERKGDTLFAKLPNQPPAGKIVYQIIGKSGDQTKKISKGHIVIRFKGHVPGVVLIIHILLMFVSFFFAIFTGLLAINKHPKMMFYALITLILLGLGGFVLGPLVQKYAFGVYWSGIPFGWDLTDNKLLVLFITWLIGYVANLKQDRRWWIVAAMAIYIVVFTIPHSALGSELDRESGKVGTSENFKDKG